MTPLNALSALKNSISSNDTILFNHNAYVLNITGLSYRFVLKSLQGNCEESKAVDFLTEVKPLHCWLMCTKARFGYMMKRNSVENKVSRLRLVVAT